jgi:hypothetical protein
MVILCWGLKAMNNKIVSLVFCTLMIVTVIPVTALPFSTEKISQYQTIIHSIGEKSRSYGTPPLPGDMPMFSYPGIPTLQTTTIRHHPELSISRTNDVVINLIQQVDPVIYLGYLEDLVAFGPRETDTPACRAAATYIYNQFTGMGLSTRYDNWSYGGYSASNIEATLPGSDTSSDDIYIICGHYDSVSVSPGADDDGTGTVATILAASLMSQYSFNYTIRFVTFSGEEQGLLGSAHYAAEAASQGDNIIGVLNADMIGYAVTHSEGDKLIVYENSASEWLYTYTLNVENTYHSYIDLILTHGGSIWGSDHNSFWDEGYSALFYFEYHETPYYHSSGDTIAHMNISYATKNTKLIIATLAELAGPGSLSNPPATPTINGPTQGVVNENYSYTVMTNDPDGDNVYYFVDWGDGANSGWVGPYPSGMTVTLYHTWTTQGTYQVRARAKDVNSAMSDWSALYTVTILVDRAPNTPTITGPARGKIGVSYLYSFVTTDPDGDMIYYLVDWGDNTTSDWLGPYASGTQGSSLHSWTTKGTYTIRIKAKDTSGVESIWGTLEVTMPTDLNTKISLPSEFNQGSQTVSVVTRANT